MGTYSSVYFILSCTIRIFYERFKEWTDSVRNSMNDKGGNDSLTVDFKKKDILNRPKMGQGEEDNCQDRGDHSNDTN